MDHFHALIRYEFTWSRPKNSDTCVNGDPWSTSSKTSKVAKILHTKFCKIAHNILKYRIEIAIWTIRIEPSSVILSPSKCCIIRKGFATGVAGQQGTVTLPDTWFRPPFLGLACAPIVENRFLELSMSYSTLHLECPLVLSRFCSQKGEGEMNGVIINLQNYNFIDLKTNNFDALKTFTNEQTSTVNLGYMTLGTSPPVMILTKRAIIIPLRYSPCATNDLCSP